MVAHVLTLREQVAQRRSVEGSLVLLARRSCEAAQSTKNEPNKRTNDEDFLVNHSAGE